VCVCVCVYVYVSVRLCVCVCVCARARARVTVCVRVRVTEDIGPLGLTRIPASRCAALSGMPRRHRCAGVPVRGAVERRRCAAPVRRACARLVGVRRRGHRVMTRTGSGVTRT
jgi:hypothetical protein